MADISLTKAKKIISTAFAKGKEDGMKPLAAVVVDAGGHVKAFERQDGAAPGRFNIAFGKAYGCVMMGMTGTALRDRAEQQAYFITAAGASYDGNMIPVPGGVLVRDKKGAVIGAVGVTGDTSENDLIAATAGIEAANLTAEG